MAGRVCCSSLSSVLMSTICTREVLESLRHPGIGRSRTNDDDGEEVILVVIIFVSSKAEVNSYFDFRVPTLRERKRFHTTTIMAITTTSLHDRGNRRESSSPVVQSDVKGAKQAQVITPPPCGACPYCSDTCGDATCVACDSKLTGHECLSESSCGSVSDCCLRQYTMCEIRRHNTAKSAWLVVGDTIYDATEYVSRHPGGEASILRKAGGRGDCTMDYNFHSRNGKRIWKKYVVGKVCKCPGKNGRGLRQWWKFWA